MAQTIKIKRSTVTAVPATLAQGELAYSAEGTSNKLFIGTPGTGDVIPIGGKYYVDIVDGLVTNGKIELTGDVTGTSVYNSSTNKWEINTSIAPVAITGNSGNVNFNVPDDDILFNGDTAITVTASKVGNQITVNIDHDDSSVTPGSYGSSTKIPTFTVDQQGHLTAAGEADVATILNVVDDDGTVNAVDLLNDSLSIVTGSHLTTNFTSADTLTITHDDSGVAAGSYGSTTTVPTYTVDAKGHLTVSGSVGNYLTMTADSGSAQLDNQETFTVDGGTKITTSITGNTVTINHDTTTRTDTTSSASVSAGGSFTAIDSVTSDSTGHVTAVNVKTVTLFDPALSITGDSGSDSVDLDSETLNFEGGSNITTTVSDDNVKIDLDSDISLTDVTVGGVLTTDDVTNFSVSAGNVDTAASALNFYGGAGTGTGAGGDIVFYVAPPAGSTGSTVNAHEVAVTISDDKSMVIEGNLTVKGTTTSVNSNEVNIGDSIILLNSDETGTPSQNGGIEIERGTSANVALRWNETTDKWQTTVDGTNYSNLITVANFEAEITVLDGGTF